MGSYWTWGGEYFGYRYGNSLFTHSGTEAGRFHEDEVYGADGMYLGEVRNGNRLIVNRGKMNRRRSSFTPRQTMARMRYSNYMGYMMYSGYQDFPAPDSF
jgi:hypothetical protein